MKEHVAFLKKYYDSGNFLVSGRKIPRDGGVILCVADSPEQVDAIIREDPFHAHGLATFRVIRFRASQRAKDMPAADRRVTRIRNIHGRAIQHPCRGAAHSR